ncbi:MAG: amidohydrolase family protein [Chloroflexi bacterium]|nr:amidohydrolase family protein [Chloroflexota bacterium]
MKIDVHCHYVPESCLELQGQGPDPTAMVGDMTDLDRRLLDMDAMGVDIQAISPWLGFLNRDPAIAHRVNDGIAQAVDLHSDRLVGLAAVPISSPAEAAAELERAVKELGLRGVEIGSNVGGKNLDARELAPFYAKVQELDVPVFIHPVAVLGMDRLQSYHLGNLIGNPTDTAVAAACLIFGGVLKEFPRLKFYLAHGGGSCPYLRGRWEHGWHVREDVRIAIKSPPSEYFKLLYFDSLVHSPAALSYLVDSVGAERVMLGTDYPFDMGDHDPIRSVDSLSNLSDGQREMVIGGNAAALLKID